MKTVTIEQIIDYVLAQPDDKPVNNYENYSSAPCGCVMIQFGKDILGLKEFSCGFSTWEIFLGEKIIPESKIEIKNYDIMGVFGMGLGEFLKINTFGELKPYLLT